MAAPWHGDTAVALPTRTTSAGSFSTNSSGSRSFYATVPSGVAAEYYQSPQQTARTAGGAGCSRGTTVNIASGSTFYSWVNSAGIEVVRVQVTATATFQLQFWNGSGWTAVGAATAITGGGSTRWRWQIDWSGLGGASGTLRLRVIDDVTETVVMDVSGSGLGLTAATNIDRMRIYAGNNSNSAYNFNNFFMKDGSAMTALAYGSRITADGTDTDGTGDYTAVDDTASGGVDFSSLSASGNRRSYKSAARSFGGRAVKSVGFALRAKCGATGPTQVKPYLKIGGTRYYHASSPVTLTTVEGDSWYGWETDPSTGAAWGATNAESANLEFGVEVV